MLVPALCDQRPDSAAVSLWYVAGKLGRRERSAPWLVDTVQDMVDHEGFPPPLPLRIGRRRIAGVHHQSRWIRDAVDAWFDGLIPPQLAAVRDAALPPKYAGLLDSRAAELAAA